MLSTTPLCASAEAYPGDEYPEKSEGGGELGLTGKGAGYGLGWNASKASCCTFHEVRSTSLTPTGIGANWRGRSPWRLGGNIFGSPLCLLPY